MAKKQNTIAIHSFCKAFCFRVFRIDDSGPVSLGPVSSVSSLGVIKQCDDGRDRFVVRVSRALQSGGALADSRRLLDWADAPKAHTVIIEQLNHDGGIEHSWRLLDAEPFRYIVGPWNYDIDDDIDATTKEELWLEFDEFHRDDSAQS